MSGSKGKFSFRMSADDAKGVVDVFRQVSTQSDEVKRAFDRLIQSSPQLASVNDNVQRKMRDTAEAMKQTGAAAKDAHSTRGGYISNRGASVISYHKKYGEVSRCTIRPEMVQQ